MVGPNRDDWTAVLCETDGGTRPRAVGRSSGFDLEAVLARVSHHADPFWTLAFVDESARRHGGVATVEVA